VRRSEDEFRGRITSDVDQVVSIQFSCGIAPMDLWIDDIAFVKK
jgi:hypothetical protein